jgi:hypothetical protein
MLANPNAVSDGANPSPRQWQVPSPDPDTAAHASMQNVLRRAQMPQPEYRALAA